MTQKKSFNQRFFSGNMKIKFSHIIPNCNHAVALAIFLSSLTKSDDHRILMAPAKYHRNDYFEDAKKKFPNIDC